MIGFLDFLPAKRALRTGVVFASLASTDAPQCHASADVLRRPASDVLYQSLLRLREDRDSDQELCQNDGKDCLPELV